MLTINTIELFMRVFELMQDGADTVELFIDSDESSISFSAYPFEDYEEIEYDPIFDCNSPESSTKISVSPDSPAPLIPTFQELITVSTALHNAIKYSLEQLDSTSLPAYDRSKISTGLKDTEALCNRLDKFLSDFLTKEPK